MHINYYDFDENSNQHEEFLNSLQILCDKYNIKNIPKIISYGVEDSTVAIYILDNDMRLYWGCPWCEESNEEEFKKLTSLSREEWLDYLNPTRDFDEAYNKEIEFLKTLSKDELILKIKEHKENFNNIKLEYDTANLENKKVGLAMKMLLEKINISRLEEMLDA